MSSSDRTSAPDADDLSAPQTQIVADRETYLGQSRHDLGRRISDDQVELFISSDVASALQQEFSLNAPHFVAVHDVGTSASVRLLASLADASRSKVQRLTVRRQGQGVALAVLQFVEARPTDGPAVRVYATDINADNATRSQVAQVLLAYSRLGVLLVGTLPPHALSSQLAPLAEALRRGPWPNRDLLMVPLGSGTALAAQGSQLAGDSGLRVQVTPQANKPGQVWNFVVGAWNRLHPAGGASPVPSTAPSTAMSTAPSTAMSRAVARAPIPDHEAVTQAMDLEPLPQRRVVPAPSRPMPLAGAGTTPWQAYAERCAQIKGSLSCCVFDCLSAQALAHAGGLPPAERLAQQGAALLKTMHEAACSLGLGGSHTEATISTGGHHLLLLPVAGHPGVAVHLVLAASAVNLTLARAQLERIDPPA